MTDEDRFAELEKFIQERGQDLLRQAVLLTGSREAGEDLLQEALVRLLRHWSKIEGDPEGYVRRTLYKPGDRSLAPTEEAPGGRAGEAAGGDT